MRVSVCCSVLLVALAEGAPAIAQDAPPPTPWTLGTTLSGFGGVGVDGEQAAALAGGGFGWEVTPRLSIEVDGSWLDRGRDATGFAADVSGVLALVSPRRLAPYVRFGFGAYRASFDRTQSPIPAFYARRMDVDGPFLPQRVSFNDPSFIGGAGMSAWLGPHASLRPEIEVRAVTRGGRAYWLTTVALRLSYHFEEHPRSARRP
jgi:hypothetical protein